MAKRGRGGDNALLAWPLVVELFCVSPYKHAKFLVWGCSVLREGRIEAPSAPDQVHRLQRYGTGYFFRETGSATLLSSMLNLLVDWLGMRRSGGCPASWPTPGHSTTPWTWKKIMFSVLKGVFANSIFFFAMWILIFSLYLYNVQTANVLQNY